jgi:hypothetical protein
MVIIIIIIIITITIRLYVGSGNNIKQVNKKVRKEGIKEGRRRPMKEFCVAKNDKIVIFSPYVFVYFRYYCVRSALF